MTNEFKRMQFIAGLLTESNISEGSWEVDPTYTHFAVDKNTGKIVTGWEYDSDMDKESILYYTKMDLKDMDLDPKNYKISTKKFLLSKGIDPFDSDNWVSHNSIDEMSLNSSGVPEFLSNITNHPELIKKLGFSSFEHLKNYIEDADYKEWNQIRNEFEDLIKKVEQK